VTSKCTNKAQVTAYTDVISHPMLVSVAASLFVCSNLVTMDGKLQKQLAAMQ
jgi:hypothetical protein